MKCLPDIEKNIGELSHKARDGKSTIEDLQGGLSQSLMEVFTALCFPPVQIHLNLQWMHNIIQRPIAVNGNIEIRPVMYLALSYDHRIIDGKEAVSFLKIVKESLEQPKRLFLNI